MKRRAFLTGTVTGALGGVVAAVEETKPVAANAAPLLATPVALMAPRKDGVELVWAVSRLCRGWVEWKNAEGESGKVARNAYGFVPQEDGVFKVRVDGLKAGVVYEIRAVIESAIGAAERVETPWKKFRTLDPAAAGARFVVWNDTHENHETIRALHHVTPESDFLLWNGDTCNDWKEESQLIPTLLNPAGQDITQGRPMFLTWGNHDVRGRWAWKVPDCIATPEGRPFYAFRHGPVAVICLHTGEDKPDAHPSFEGRAAFEPLRREQAEWLKEITARPEFRDAPNRIVFCHIPLRGIEEPETVDYAGKGFDRYARSSRDLWHDTLIAWGAQVIISGHTHQQTWLPANDKFPYAQLISGGPRPDIARWIEGTADASGLKLTVRDLTGNVTHEANFPRVG